MRIRVAPADTRCDACVDACPVAAGSGHGARGARVRGGLSGAEQMDRPNTADDNGEDDHAARSAHATLPARPNRRRSRPRKSLAAATPARYVALMKGVLHEPLGRYPLAPCVTTPTPPRRSRRSRAHRSRTTTSCSRLRTGHGSPRSRPAPMRRLGAASSFFPTFAACTTSTRSSPCGSASRASRPSRSTTSAARPGSGSATRTSRMRSTSPLTTGAGIQADVARSRLARSIAGCRRPSSRSASASADATRGSRRPAATSSPAPSASTARPGRGTASPGRASGRPSSARRSSRSWAAPTRRSRRTTSPRSTRPSPRPAWSTTSSTYAGAPHSFFDRKQEQFADASADAWRRVLAFFESHTPA